MNVAIVGAGLMGSGIAQVFSFAGHDVVLHDRNAHALQRAEARIDEINSLLGIERIAGTLTMLSDPIAAVRSADLVIEAIVEDLAAKCELFRDVSAAVSSDTILASNTSAIPISKIAEAVTQPGRLLGLHFWNPPWAVDLVEVVQGNATTPEMVQRAMQIIADLAMQPVHVRRDVPGFIGNRLQHALKREAIALVANGVCDAETVDTVVKSGFGLRLGTIGPLEQSDMVGLDLTLSIHETLISDLDRHPGPAALLSQKVAEGSTGMSAGRGFREWDAASSAEVRKRLDESLATHGRARLARLRRKAATDGGMIL